MLETVLVPDGAAHAERQVEAGAHVAMHGRVGRARGGDRLVGIVDVDLVGVAVPAVVEFAEFEPWHGGVLAGTEGAPMNPWKVADVEEVVDHPGCGDAPLLHATVDPAERRINVVRDRRNRIGGFTRAEPHQAVALLDGVTRQVRCGRHGTGVAHRRNADASTGRAERPPVVAARQHALGNRADRQRRLPVRATVGGCDQHSFGITPQHVVGPEQPHPNGCGDHVAALGDGMPCRSELSAGGK